MTLVRVPDRAGRSHPSSGASPHLHEEQPPAHDEVVGITRLVEWLCLVVAIALVLCQVVRLGLSPQVFGWWVLPIVLAGMLSADLISGLVHWTADTWFEETMPVLGRRFFRPFRVHHVNPEDFLRRDVIDTNGDVAMLTVPVLTAMFWLPLGEVWGLSAAVFLLALCVAVLPTNQVHQWAHMRRPPVFVSCLQRYGPILGRGAHRRHHAAPFITNYCIALGWCNPVLNAVGFFRGLEWLVSRTTGLRPRADDASFRTSV